MNVLPAVETSRTVWRALVHIAIGLGISIAAFFLSRGIMLVALGLAALGVLLVDLIRLRGPGFNAWFCRFFQPFLRDYETARLLGASFLIVSSLVVYTVFSLKIAVLAITFLAVGDPSARLVGERFGGWRLFRKNIWGVLACLIVCLAAASIWRYAGLSVPIAVALTGAAAAAIAEGLPTAIDDNLTIPLLSGFIMWLVSFLV
jgi:glycerol-3-phosphate acyltransferase PlsY